MHVYQQFLFIFWKFCSSDYINSLLLIGSQVKYMVLLASCMPALQGRACGSLATYLFRWEDVPEDVRFSRLWGKCCPTASVSQIMPAITVFLQVQTKRISTTSQLRKLRLTNFIWRQKKVWPPLSSRHCLL